MPLALTRNDLLLTKNFIAGQWRDARGARRSPVEDPATGEVFTQVSDSGEADAADAADAAYAAFPSWRAQTARQRAQVIKRWHAAIMANADDLAKLISREQGKPLHEARGEVLYGAAYVEWFAEEAVRAHGDVIPRLVPGRNMLVVKEPVGVVAAITPWNFPLAMIARKIAPALAAGCTVVAKPAEDTPLTAPFAHDPHGHQPGKQVFEAPGIGLVSVGLMDAVRRIEAYRKLPLARSNTVAVGSAEDE